MSTLRNPTAEAVRNLFICNGEESQQVEGLVSLVVDCWGGGGKRKNGVIRRPRRPHRWSPEDLDQIVAEVRPRLEAGERVLIHCHSGRSRSTTAAAAVLLDMRVARNPIEAVEMVALGARIGETEEPDRRCIVSLREWWEGRCQQRLFAGMR